MRLGLRDLVGALLVAAIAIPYVGYLVNGEMPFIRDPGGMVATGLVLGTVAFLVMRRGDRTDRTGRLEIAFAVVTCALGLVALALAETVAADILLAAFLTAVLVLFVVEILDHAGVVGHESVAAQRR